MKNWRKKVSKNLTEGLRKVGTFIKVLWRDRWYLAVKLSYLGLFAVALKAIDNPATDTNMASLCAVAAGLMCIIPADSILPEESKKNRRRKRRKTGGMTDVL